MDGQNISREIAFSQSVINVGADSGNDIVLRGNGIADFQIMLHYDSNRWFITSLDKGFQTTVNNRVLGSDPEALPNGSVISIGAYRLTVMLNGVNTDIIMQYQSDSVPEDVGFAGEFQGSNIQLSITGAPQTEIDAGMTAEFELMVQNAGPLVANMQLQVQGIPSSWVQIIPPVLNLNEGRRGTFQVKINPPRSPESRAGLYNLHFIALSPNYQRETGVADTTLTILPYSEFLLNGPSPRQVSLNRHEPNAEANVVVINNSNAPANFMVRSYDDSNEMNFSYEQDGGGVIQGQETITVMPGDNDQIPVIIGSHKLPLIGISNRHRHYYTSVTPSDRPGDTQSVVGEVVVKPLINAGWVIFGVILLLIAAVILLQPYIHTFEGEEGKRTLVVMSGNAASMTWRVSPMASKVTIDDGTGPAEVAKTGSNYVNPTTSTTYVLRAENVLSRLLNLTYEKTIQVLTIPNRPNVNLFRTDKPMVLYNQPVTLNWSVEENASRAVIISNKQSRELKPDEYSGNATQGFTTDTLISIKAENDSGYDTRSLFVNVSPQRVDLQRFTAWVRPNGVAVPNDNDVRRVTRWSSLDLMSGNTGSTVRPAPVSPQPAPQSNTLVIPDDFTGTNSPVQSMSPEEMSLSGHGNAGNTYTYQPPVADTNSSDLLISTMRRPTPGPAGIPEAEIISRSPLQSSAAPAASPEGSGFNRDFSIKLVEVIEDPLAESGYRVVDYFPDYVVQQGEQVLLEWSVDGVSQIKIDGLSSDNLNASGGDYVYPEKSTTYVLNAEVGEVKKAFSLPVRVAGESDDGEGSGLKCELKANATTLKVPGTVMLTWTGGGTNRVQLVSSAKAESEAKDAEKQKEEEAKAKGESYTKPTAPAPMNGGTIGDWLQPSGFMRVNVDKQTIFVLNAYDGSGNVICTKSVEVKYEGGNDKEDIPSSSFKITRIADDNDVVQSVYTVGQMVHYTVAFSGFDSGKEPTGSVMITDGTSTCSVTLPVTSCAFTAKKAGELTVTAVYSGDDNYKKATTTAKERVINKMPTTLEIMSAYKPETNLADVVAHLTFDQNNSLGLAPTGTITFTAGSGTCDLTNIENANAQDDKIDESLKMKLTCNGEVVADAKDPYLFTITDMLLADETADRITATYKGDNYFSPSTARPVLFHKVTTTTEIGNDPMPTKYPDGKISLSVEIKPDPNATIREGKTFTGKITLKTGEATACVYDIDQDAFENCSGNPVVRSANGKFEFSGLVFTGTTGNTITAEYSGDSYFRPSTSQAVAFRVITKIDTQKTITTAFKTDESHMTVVSELTWEPEEEKVPTGTITYTIGTGTCVLDFSNLQAPKLSCEKDELTISPVSAEEAADGKIVFTIEKMQISDQTADRITAAYSGDADFNPSTSTQIMLTKVDTESVINYAFKPGESIASLESVLSWDPADLPEGAKEMQPTGTITYTAGSGTCVLTLGTEPKLSCRTAEGGLSVDLSADKDALTAKIVEMLLADKTADRVTAAYSGDALFNPSTSEVVLFNKVDTVTKVLEAYKPVASSANIIASLTRVEADWEAAGCTKDGVTCPAMTGTLTYTFGGQTCVLDIVKQTMDCSGTVNVKDSEYSLLNVLLSDQNADRVKIAYSGDAFYNPSTASETLFNRVLTESVISDASKRTVDGQHYTDFTFELTWLDEPKDGATPTGTITFTAGGKTCDLDLVTGILGCDGKVAQYGSRFVIEGMALGEEDPDSIIAEYSGDSAFHPSTSQPWKFDMIDTQIEITRAFKPDDTITNLVALLTWDEEKAEGKTPTGTVTFIASNSMVDAVTCVYNMDSKEFSCQGTITESDYEFTIEKMPVGQLSVDRIRAEYSGDDSFNPSTSKMVMFKTVGTAIKITTAEKTVDNVVSMTTELTWDEFVSGGVRPSGVIKFTSGTRTCSLDISVDPFKFTDCDGSADFTYSEADKKLSIRIEKLPMTGAGETIKAEYSGSGAYLKSESPEVHFSKFGTDLVIDGAKTFKTDNSHVTVDSYLIWNKNDAGDGNHPTGTVKFTIGSSVCTLDITAKSLDCEFGKITVDGPEDVQEEPNDRRYHLIIEDVLFEGEADRVKAEYSGDSMFNPSNASSLFKTLETETIIVNDETYKPYRPNTGYANFNVKLNWDQSQSNGRVPGGSIYFTPVNSETCVYTIGGKMSCEGKVTVIYVDPADHSKGIDHIEVRDMLMSNAASDRIKAEYKGDGFFEPSSSTTILFDTSDTATRISSAAKSPDGVVEMTVSVVPTKDHPDGRQPLGTLKITSGTKTCTLEISDTEQKLTDCEGEVTFTDGNYHIIGLQMGAETSGSSIRAEYSGDSYFRNSTSPTYDFVKANTTLTITKAAKPGDPEMADVTAVLSWRKDDAPDRSPSGNIRFTIGGDTCILSRIENETPGFNCTGDDTTVTRVYSHEASDSEWSYTFTLKNILLSAATADRILAEYNGDALFNSSTSKTVLFKTVPTQVQVRNAVKTETDYADIIGVLNWDETLSDGKTPSGTLKITVGSGTCTLDIAEKKLSCYAKETPVITVNEEKNQMTFDIHGMLLDDTNADRVQLEYSGDGFFLTSSSTKVLFDTIPTDITITDASRTQSGIVSLKSTLSWINTSPTGRTPSGTIKFTSGTGTCTVEISGSTAKFKDCTGTVTPVLDVTNRTFTLTVTNMMMGTRAGENIKAEYSGDGGFLPSVSDTIAFDKSDTELVIDSTSTYKVSDSLTNISADLTWAKDPEDDQQKASGTIKFTIGSGVCTLDLSAKTVSDCESKAVTVTDTDDGSYKGYHVVITELLLADKTADRVKAEYSGDSIFNPSSSTALFKTVETAIVIVNDNTYKPYRPSNGYANFNTRLTWDESAANGRTPGGTITFTTIFPDPLVSTKCVYDLVTGKMDCEGRVSFVPAAEGVPAHYEIRNMLMNYARADRVKAEYSGDGFFLPSTGTTVLFDMSDTTTRITNAAKSPEGVVEMTVSVVPTKAHPDDRAPLGTLKIISGTKTCTLELAANSQKFSDCEGVVEITSDGSYHITELQMGAETSGTSIRAEYSGDSFFLSSTSPTIDFVKVDTGLRLDSVYKPGNRDLADLVVTLSWDKVKADGKSPSGTIRFTIGSDTCTMTRLENDTPGFNCSGGSTVITRTKAEPADNDTWSYTWTINNILLSSGTADRAKAEYTGDAVFNGSSSDTVMFKTVPTEISVSKAFKKGSDYADISAALSWDNSLSEGRKPSGTVKFTAGSGSCILDIETKVLSCEPKTGTVSDDRRTYSVTGMLLDDKTADRVQVEYSGDGFFEPSVSSKVLFQTISTDLVISAATKRQPGFIGLTTELHWVDDAGTDTNPTGTIKFTSGTGTCTLDISGSAPKFTDCDGQVPAPVKNGNRLIYTISNMYFGGKAGDTIKAEYSGDGLFLTSSSETLTFTKQDTILEITEAYKPEAGLANSTVRLSWLRDESLGNKPTGSIKLTIGGSICTLNMEDNSFNCSGESTVITGPDKENPVEYEKDSKTYLSYRWKFEKILISDTNADRVKADYSGDGFFNESTSVTVLFKTIPTILSLTRQSKNTDGTVNVTTELSWLDDTPAGVTPHGTIKFTSGTGTCTLNLNTGRFNDCEGTITPASPQGDKNRTYTIMNMKIGDGSGTNLIADYSGDGYFLTSTSNSVDFNKVNTTLVINEAYKPGAGLSNISTDLTWTVGENPGEAPEGTKPTGTITFTIGSDSCRLNITTNEFNCSGQNTEGLEPDDTTDGALKWAIKNIVLSSNTADRVKAEYSGDAIFNPSSSVIVMFKTIPTTISLNKQGKTTAGLVNVTTELEWTDSQPMEMAPHGTIKFTSGSGTCTLSLDTESFTDCEGTVTPAYPQGEKKLTYTITNLKFGNGAGTDIKAEYSGDGFFLASASEPKDFDKVDTELRITQAYKPGSNLANVNTLLSWNRATAGESKPTGTINFTIGSDTCKLDIVTGVFDCNGEQTRITRDPEQDDDVVDRISWNIEKMILSSNTADRVQAVYSGDGIFNGSSSVIVLFKTIETNLSLSGFKKTASGYLGTTVNLNWGEETESPYSTMKPSGTIKLSSGTGICTISFTGENARWTDCQGDDIRVTSGTSSLSFDVKNLDMGEKAGDSIKAEYSGDVIFLPSASDSQFFNKIDTELDITGAYKGDNGLANLTAALSWMEADAGSSEPSGSITYTIGSDSCKMDIVTKSFSCSGASTVVSDPEKKTTTDGKVVWTWTITNIMLSSTNADRVKADYSGDAIFNTSSSKIILFQNVETTLKIENQAKSSDGRLSLDLDLSWADEPPAGMTPGGTIKLTSGTAVCTMVITNDSPRFTDCQGTVALDADNTDPKSRIYLITNLNMGNKAGEDLKAEYSGDGTFLASVSDTVLFSKNDTSLEITSATKTGDFLVNVTSKLSWNPVESGIKPQTGAITFTIGSETCKMTYDLDIQDPNLESIVEFNCAGEATRVKVTDDSANGSITWAVTDILLNSNTADRVKAEYSGDANFNPSSSKIVLFPTVATTTSISNQNKTDNWVQLNVVLGWAATAPAGKTPTGTIKLTSGSAVCSMEIAGDTPQFISPCTGSIQASTSGYTRTFEISDLYMGSDIGDDIKAEYSGDGVFMTSASDTLYFNKVNTNLEISRAWKYDTSSLANIDAVLTWNEDDAGSSEPSGTVKFTIGSDTCTMDISAETITCTGSGTVAHAELTEPGTLSLTLRKVLLNSSGADRVKAEYAGDLTFNPSTSTTVMFETAETSTSIRSAIKKNNGKVDLTAQVNWTVEAPVGVTPIGTLVFTSGSKSCTLNLATLKFSDCTSDPVTKDGEGRLSISNLEMGTDAGTTIRAEYSGDSYFTKSVSPTVEFSKVDTTLSIDGAVKIGDGTLINAIVSLEWIKEKALSNEPTGTITLTIGSDTCKLKINKDENPDDFSCSGDSTEISFEETEPNEKMKWSWTVKNIVLKSASADRITAAYDGDSIFNASESRIVKFKTVDTRTEITNAVKVGDGSLVDVDLLLIWAKNDAVDNEPTGTMTMTIGSDNCKLTIDKDNPANNSNLTCAGENTKIALEITEDEFSGDKTHHWKLENIVLTSKTADRITATYDGDHIFNKSESLIVMFRTVPTEIKILTAMKPDGNHASVTADLTWNSTLNTEDREPSGTVKFNVGSGSCTLNIETKALTCEQEGITVETDKTAGKVHMEIQSMLLDDSSADRVYAEYSGDSYFDASTSTKILLQKRDPGLEITKITDENGIEHTSFYTPGQKVQIVTTMTKAVKNPAPTGSIKIYLMNQENGEVASETCTVTLPQSTCMLTLPEDTFDIVQAVYDGDVAYNSDTAEKSITMKEPQPLKLEIVKITDVQGVDQESYHIDQEAVVTLKITDIDENEKPTGNVTVKVDTASCTAVVSYPGEFSCTLELPHKEKTWYDVTAEYGGNTYYQKAEAKPDKVAVEKYDIDLEITSITNVEKDQNGNTVYIEQPYYVYDSKAGTGQTVRVCAKLNNAEHGDPDGSVMININDKAHDDGAQLVSFSVADGCGTYQVRKYTGQITLTASYPGDDVYNSAETEKTMVVQNRFEPGLDLYYASRYRTDRSIGIIGFYLYPESTIHEDYDDVSLIKDDTVRPATTQKVSLKFGSDVCVFDLVTAQFTEGGCSVAAEDIFQYSTLYLLGNVSLPETAAEELTAEYDGNRYFYNDESTCRIDIEEGGYTRISLFDVLKINYPDDTHNGHMFLNAVLTYDQYTLEQFDQKPKGSLQIAVGGEVKTCNFDLTANTFMFADDNTKSCGTMTEENNSIRFIIPNIDVPNSADKVGVDFKPSSDTDPFEPSGTTWSEITTEPRPSITYTNAEKTTLTTADLEITVNGMGTLTRSYKVYDRVRLGSQGETADPSRETCTFDTETLNWIAGTCSGTIAKNFDADTGSFTYTITGFEGIIREDDVKASATLLNALERWVDAEYPTTETDYVHKKAETKLNVSDVLKYMDKKAFLTFDIEYDASHAAAFDKYPSRNIEFEYSYRGIDKPKTCYIYWNTEEADEDMLCPGAEIKSTNPEREPSWIVNVDVEALAELPEYTRVRLKLLGDDYYKESEWTDYIPFTEESPVIDIHNAVHIADGNVYTDFTITGMGTLSEKYGVNKEIRFTSKPGGKTCVYNRINEAFDGGCEGTLTISGSTYTLIGLTNLYSENDTQLSISVSSPYLEESEYAHSEIAYGKLETGFMLSNELKVMNKHTFLTADFNYETEITGRYNVKPSGIFSFTTSAGTCSFNIKTGETSAVNSEGEPGDICYVWYDELAEMNGKIHFIVKKLASDSNTRAITVGYSGDDFLKDINLTRDIDIDAHPVIAIKEGSAVKTSLRSANVTFQVVAAGHYADIYGSFFDQIKLYSNSGRASYINISDIMEVDDTSGTASFINPTHTGSITWTKEGDTVTFTVTGWSGPIDTGDTTCTVELMSHTYLAESEYPKDDEPFGHNTGWTNLTVSDVYSAAGSHVYLTAVLSYDPDIADAYVKRPSGTLTITGNNGGTPKVCEFGLYADLFHDVNTSDRCGTVEVDAANHKATFVVRTYEGAAGTTVNRVQVQYNGDEYFNQSAASANSDTESPTVAISYLLRSLESDSSGNGYVMFTVDGIDENTLAGKYNVYPYIRLMRHTTGSAADYCLFDRAANTFTGYNNCHADEIIVNGNTYIFKNLNGEWDGQKIIQPRHNSFEVSLYPNIVTDRWSVTSYPMDYQLWLDRLNTSLSLPEIVKVSDRHVFVKAELTSDLNSLVVANAFGVSPTGTIHFTSGGLNCICDIDAGTCTGGCEAEVTKTVGTWPITMLVRNPTGTDVGTQIDAAYNSDRLFRYSDMTGTFVNGAPTITIDSAQKLSNTKANVTVTVHGNDYVEYYSSVYDQIRLAAHDGEYNYIENISDILRSSSTSGTATLSIGSGEVSWTKSGNDVTFTVTNWEGPIDAEDTQCTAWLLAYGLTEDQYPKAGPRTFTHTKGQVTLSFDGKVLNEHNDNFFMDVVLDYDPQTAAGFQKPKGRLTLRGYAVSTTCDFDLNQSTVSCEQSGFSAQVLSVDETAHKAIIRIRKFHSYGGSYMRVTAANDDFYTYTGVGGSNVAVRETPVVTVNHAFKGVNQVGTAQITIQTTEALEKFGLYPRVMLYSGKNDDDAHNAAFELRAENPQFESPVTGTITGSYDPDTYTYTFMIRDMKDMIGADDTYLKAAANDNEIGHTLKSNPMDYETISTNITLTDLLVLIDGSGNEHGFGKINFSFGELAKTFNFWPDGWMRVISAGRWGYVNVADTSSTVDTYDFGNFTFEGVKDESAHTYQILMKNKSVQNNTSRYQVIYNQDPRSGDYDDFNGQFYKDSIFSDYATGNASYTRVIPSVTISSAKKYPVTNGGTTAPAADVTFTLSGIDGLVETWKVFNAVRLSTGDGSKYSDIDLTTNRFSDGSGTVSRSGDTFTVTGWKNFSSSSDTSVKVSLVSNFSGIMDVSKTEIMSRTVPSVEAVDLMKLGNYRYLTILMTYTENGVKPSGKFDISTNNGTCTYNLADNSHNCQWADIKVKEETGQTKVVISGWYNTNSFTSVNAVNYSNDPYYSNTQSPINSNIRTLSNPNISTISAVDTGSVGRVVFTVDNYGAAYSKYNIIRKISITGTREIWPYTSHTSTIYTEDIPVDNGTMKVSVNGDIFTVSDWGEASQEAYDYCEITLEGDFSPSVSVRKEFGYSLTSASPLTSGSPVTLTVGGFEPVSGE